MTAKEYLRQYGEAVRLAARLQIEYEKEKALIDSIQSGLGGDGTPRGGSIGKATEAKAVRLADKALKLKDAELEAVRIRQEIFDCIRQVPGEMGSVLYERYINLKSWREVASAVGYSKSRAHDLHNEGIEYLKKVSKNKRSDTIGHLHVLL